MRSEEKDGFFSSLLTPHSSLSSERLTWESNHFPDGGKLSSGSG